MKKSEIRQIIKEEIKRALNESMFEGGELVTYMGTTHKIVSDNGYVVKLVNIDNGVTAELNYAQVDEKVRVKN